MLDKFWAVPSVKSWVSRKWIDFKIVAAAGTSRGVSAVRQHRLGPEVLFQHVAPTIYDTVHAEQHSAWLALIENRGPHSGNPDSAGFDKTGALIAFTYRFPNNVPTLISESGRNGWNALYAGAPPEELRPLFGRATPEERVALATETAGLVLAEDLSAPDAQIVIVLGSLGGRWRTGMEPALSELTGFAVPEISAIKRKAVSAGLLDAKGRLTELGQEAVLAGLRTERRRPTIPSVDDPYYPKQLRAPRVASSTRRSSGRPG
jgi:hypothetical protein